MQLKDLLCGLSYKIICGKDTVQINGISYNTKNINTGNVFVCIKGYSFDSHKRIKEIVSCGINAVVVESTDDIEAVVEMDVCIIKVENTKKALAIISANYFEHPYEKLITVGITGTNGKTTTAYMIKEILTRLGIKTGLIGTIEVYDGDKTIPSINTTPASYEIMQYMNEMIRNGCKCVVMEVSSQALKLDRVYGMIFDYGLFTNISKDHISKNEHASMAEYIACKMKLVGMSKQVIVNIDDDILKTITMQPALTTERISTISVNNDAEYRASNITYIKKHGELTMEYNMFKRRIKVAMPCIFNVYNSIMALATVNEIMRNTVCSFGKLTRILSEIKVKGRLQCVKSVSGKTVFIDYAHNGCSMENLLKEIKKYPHEKMIVIFGCGGNRAKDRRYAMGEMAAKYADVSIITSDNPRWEEPMSIIYDIEQGFDKVIDKGIKVIEPDRLTAIKKALSLADKEDLILLIGKGHENYQEIKGIKYPLDEEELITSCSELNS